MSDFRTSWSSEIPRDSRQRIARKLAQYSIVCNTCEGTGKDPNKPTGLLHILKPSKCGTCLGRGRLLTEDGYAIMTQIKCFLDML